jgi:hypothetical protein
MQVLKKRRVVKVVYVYDVASLDEADLYGGVVRGD